MLTKICSTCVTEKSLDFYPKGKGYKDGHANQCKSCKQKKSAEWAKNNREKRLKSYKKHNAKRLESMRTYSKQYRKDNLELCKKRCSDYKKKNPEKMKEYKDSSIRNRSGFTKEFRIYLKTLRSMNCWYCLEKGGTIDHILPLEFNGTDEWFNLAPACISCNSSKQHKDLGLWLREKNLPFACNLNLPEFSGIMFTKNYKFGFSDIATS